MILRIEIFQLCGISSRKRGKILEGTFIDRDVAWIKGSKRPAGLASAVAIGKSRGHVRKNRFGLCPGKLDVHADKHASAGILRRCVRDWRTGSWRRLFGRALNLKFGGKAGSLQEYRFAA